MIGYQQPSVNACILFALFMGVIYIIFKVFYKTQRNINSLNLIDQLMLRLLLVNDTYNHLAFEMRTSHDHQG